MKKIFTLLLVAGLFSSCGSGGTSDGSKSDTTATEAAGDATKEPSAPETKWTYEEKVDKMTSEKKFYASVESDNKLDFEFPYDGGSTATLAIRYQDKQNESLLSISKGQFHVGSDGGTVKIRFDDKKPMTFPCSESSSGSSDLIFIENTKKLIKELKTAKKVIIQAEFYESGLKEMEFSTADFKWSH